MARLSLRAPRNQFCQQLAFRVLASRTVRKLVSVVLSHPVCAALFWESYETYKSEHILKVEKANFYYLDIGNEKERKKS